MIESASDYHRRWYEKNKTRRLAVGRIWYQSVMANPDEARRFKDLKNTYQRERYQNDPAWRIRCSLKKLITYFIKSGGRAERCIDVCGCDQNYLKNFLERQFTEGMSWLNYGKDGWSVDHVIPCCRFNLLEDEQRRWCFHYTNLQPLCYEANRQKSTQIL